MRLSNKFSQSLSYAKKWINHYLFKNLPTNTIYESPVAGKCNRGFRLGNPLIPKSETCVADIGIRRCT